MNSCGKVENVVDGSSAEKRAGEGNSFVRSSRFEAVDE
jgi:hypothetical protein